LAFAAAGAAIAGELIGAHHLQEAFLEQVAKSDNEPKGGGPRTPTTARTRRGEKKYNKNEAALRFVCLFMGSNDG
jgi:hypothetical protein